MNVPDCVSPIVAYRAWQLADSGLRSLSGESWHTGQALAAGCSVRSARHQAPHEDCACGIYAAKSLEQLRKIGYLGLADLSGISGEAYLYGEVYLWGTVIEHELGWRAQFASPKSLTLSAKVIRFDTLRTLAAYGVDIFLDSWKGGKPVTTRLV